MSLRNPTGFTRSADSGILLALFTDGIQASFSRTLSSSSYGNCVREEECIMYVQTGKTFITTLIAVVLALGGLAMLSSGSQKNVPTTLAQANPSAETSAQPASSAYGSTSTANGATPTNYEDGYRAGYRDGHQDCSTSVNTSGVRRTAYSRRYAPRTRVAGARYYSEGHRGHSTRNMILRIAAPAAIGAGIGAIARGGKGAGIGALIGGGGGALYHLIKHGRD